MILVYISFSNEIEIKYFISGLLLMLLQVDRFLLLLGIVQLMRMLSYGTPWLHQAHPRFFLLVMKVLSSIWIIKHEFINMFEGHLMKHFDETVRKYLFPLKHQEHKLSSSWIFLVLEQIQVVSLAIFQKMLNSFPLANEHI